MELIKCMCINEIYLFSLHLRRHIGLLGSPSLVNKFILIVSETTDPVEQFGI